MDSKTYKDLITNTTETLEEHNGHFDTLNSLLLLSEENSAGNVKEALSTLIHRRHIALFVEKHEYDPTTKRMKEEGEFAKKK